MNTKFEEIKISQWVQSADNDENKEFRAAVHTILSAISAEKELKANMVLKGGILLAIRYQSHRFTKDIDLSTAQTLKDIQPENIAAALDRGLANMVEILDYDLDCRVQAHKLQPANQPDATYPSIKFSIGYAYKGTSKHKRLIKLQSPSIISIDYSLNESTPNIDSVELTQGEELLVYSLTDLIAEKFRSLLQQEERNRYRRQDIFDLCILLQCIDDVDSVEKKKIRDSVLEKSRARGIDPTADSFESEELKRRAKEYYATIADEIEGDLPDFEESFKYVANFYKSLPWE
ncbi:nucleotidyl transferase AbiEii/AbiGii toxin family protein [Cellvibrio sp. NN19]|uniref:nucleotidyl transferase AbiEii/AbiGii toxin family protein n=1 Tax=Cellvibrio chitinivorans TaxID=3102792 RepID=UPI002B40155E|nr:nucleotidyl transferase AbiEii/AbiGii toxin family protein [Cellvibrio sp. NN19]